MCINQSTTNQLEKIFEKYNCQFIGLKIEDIYSPDHTFSGSYNKDLEDINNKFDKTKQLKESLNGILFMDLYISYIIYHTHTFYLYIS